MNLCSLPEELIVRILGNLEGRELISCSLVLPVLLSYILDDSIRLQVSRLFHAFIRDHSALQYNIELTVAGIEDRGSISRLSIAERLTELKNVQESWAALRFRKQQARTVTLSNVWELFGGFLACGVSTQGTRGLLFTELPSMMRGTAGRTWEHRDLGVAIRDFTIDPTQDLAALISRPVNGVYGIHLRAMSTGRPHPLATDSVLSCVAEAVRACNFIIQVMSESLAVLFHTLDRHGVDKLFVWNWRTGKVVAELEASADGNERIDSFSFLSPRHFAVSRFKLMFSSRPVLEVYDFLAQDSTDPSTPISRLVRTFEFPQVSSQGLISTMLTRSDPPPKGSALSPDVDVPFCTSLASLVLAVSITILRRRLPTVPSTYILFVHHSTLLEGLVDRQAPSVLPWAEWGPAKSRMLQTSYNEPTWVCYMHGPRYVRLEPPNDEPISPGSRIRMLDFNPHGLRRDYRKGKNEESTFHDEVYIASAATRLPALDAFQHDVVTTLPYREVWSNDSYDYKAVMIDEECIVGVLSGEAGGAKGFEFLCF